MSAGILPTLTVLSKENVMEQIFFIIAGGTFNHIAPHFALAAPAFGKVGRQLSDFLPNALQDAGQKNACVHLVLTRMAQGGFDRHEKDTLLFQAAGIKDLVTNEDLQKLIDYLVGQTSTRCIVLTAAVCDFEPVAVSPVYENDPEFGKYSHPRLSSSQEHKLTLAPSRKILARIRQDRKDIFLVSFKTTADAEPAETYKRGLALMKQNGVNLMFANDIVRHTNMVITPERFHYHLSETREEALKGLAKMISLRTLNHFTRSTVVLGEPVSWHDARIPKSLQTVVDHCVARGAYKAFNGVTVGHFAVKVDEKTILTSRRKTNFNELETVGLVEINPDGETRVIAHGSKPSVGGQSQRIIFREHPDADCIVHFHCPVKPGSQVPTRSQYAYECGSHECGQNTSNGLGSFGGIKAVMLESHGPNIVFHRDTDPQEVISFIEANFDLPRRTDFLLDTV